jgi:hypothetical protein
VDPIRKVLVEVFNAVMEQYNPLVVLRDESVLNGIMFREV